MIAPGQCQHEDAVPVETTLQDATGQALAVVVARLCLDCDEQLEAGWGCTDCEWDQFEDQMLCEPRPTIHHVLVRPCKEHA